MSPSHDWSALKNSATETSCLFLLWQCSLGNQEVNKAAKLKVRVAKPHRARVRLDHNLKACKEKTYLFRWSMTCCWGVWSSYLLTAVGWSWQITWFLNEHLPSSFKVTILLSLRNTLWILLSQRFSWFISKIWTLWVIWGQCCLRLAAGPGLPNGPITQLSPYLTQNPCTGLCICLYGEIFRKILNK